MKRLINAIMVVMFLALAGSAFAVTCDEQKVITENLRAELDALNEQFIVDKTTLVATRDLRIADVNIAHTQSLVEKAKERLSYYEDRLTAYNDKLTACLATEGADCAKKQEAVTKAEARVVKAQERLTKYQNKLSAKQAKIDGYTSSYGVKITDTIAKYETLIDAKEAEVNAANILSVSLCGNAGKGK